MDKRTILALLLILVVFWISSEFIWKSNVPQQPNEQPVENVEQTTTRSNRDLQQTTSQPNTENSNSIELTESDVAIDNNITLQNNLLNLTFSNLGAVITSIELVEYKMADKETPANLIPLDQDILGMELKLESGNTINLSTIPFQYETRDRQIIFAAETQYGKIQKSFSIENNYEVKMQIRIDSESSMESYQLAFDSGIADTENYLKMKSRDYKIVGQINNELNKFTLSKLKEDRMVNGHVNWAAIKSKYFTIAVIPDDLIDTDKLEAFNAGDSPAMNLNVNTDRSMVSHNYHLYLGPLVYKNLVTYGNGIENVVEMGPKWLQWIGKIFKGFISFLYSLIPNWGICIIIFSIVLKIILYPLTHKSFESTTKMQKINPMMKEIQKKYKKDPQTMNAELKKLYKEHGVNPMGGCLPILIQMPILFALYPILRYSIALRQASFLWLPDLSEPDPVWALPILMAVFMFVQQKLMAPSKQKLEEMDEKQKAAMQSQKLMMYFMPVMMFFIFKGLASGLVLYWTVFSVIGSVQQYFIKKKFN
ncbi:MAG: membrane protein insertase YidC [Candidatus Cloacimonetes bacterium]|nr:membrane protein insertase YidC [Candidatus Cloacimonadota bacterium]MCF7813155.1 membrane protein insertase YidC [Candidatus Cloacimonadota bacterium]MCF7867603.1 membrane protein insertase YidC [Candidatus Cloacimonadota bacterium]MCF7883122.1 membrane protein insertase YidC [Candidatus Cloacimonadota bacterium]